MDKIIGFPDVSGQFNGMTFFLKGELSNYISDKDLPNINLLFPEIKLSQLKMQGIGCMQKQQEIF